METRGLKVCTMTLVVAKMPKGSVKLIPMLGVLGAYVACTEQEASPTAVTWQLPWRPWPVRTTPMPAMA